MYSNSAFTLVELLVSVTIAGILAAVSFSIFDEYKMKAYNAQAHIAFNDFKTAAVSVGSELPEYCVDCSAESISRYDLRFDTSTDTNHNLPQTVTDLISDKLKNDPEVLGNVYVYSSDGVGSPSLEYRIFSMHCKGDEEYYFRKVYFSNGTIYNNSGVHRKDEKYSYNYWDYYC